MWRLTGSRGMTILTIELFGPMRERAALEREAERVLAFCSPDGSRDVRFGPVT
jgi:hypothetical protein